MPWFQPDWISNLNFHSNFPTPPFSKRVAAVAAVWDPRLPLGSPGWWLLPTGPCRSGLQRPPQVSPASGWRDSDCQFGPEAPSCSCCNLWGFICGYQAQKGQQTWRVEKKINEGIKYDQIILHFSLGIESKYDLRHTNQQSSWKDSGGKETWNFSCEERWPWAKA